MSHFEWFYFRTPCTHGSSTALIHPFNTLWDGGRVNVTHCSKVNWRSQHRKLALISRWLRHCSFNKTMSIPWYTAISISRVFSVSMAHEMTTDCGVSLRDWQEHLSALPCSWQGPLSSCRIPTARHETTRNVYPQAFLYRAKPSRFSIKIEC